LLLHGAAGVQLACSMIGQGPPLMKTGNWMIHLEFDLESPIWRHLCREPAKDHTLVGSKPAATAFRTGPSSGR
jgi:hypothetical protein